MRKPDESKFRTHDGSELFYRHWPGAGGASVTGRAIVLFHRGHEHSGRLQHVVDELDMPDIPMFAWDARGHGRSPGERGFSPSFGCSVKDADCFVKHICAEYGIAVEDIAVVAQSVGSVLVTTWVHDYAPRIRCMVLAAPAFKVRLYVPLAQPGLKLLHALRGNFFVNSYVKAKFLTHDPARIASYESDPLITRAIAANILLALYDAAERVIADAGAIQAPTQLLVSGADWVVDKQPQQQFFERLGSATKERHEFPGFFHDTLGERDRHLALAKAREFILRQFSAPMAPPSLTGADRAGYTKAEFDSLTAPLPAVSLKGINFALTRLGMRTFGRLSEGIRISYDTGFDSGSTLDYIYRNRAAGITPIGRLIDWFYLNSVGWRGIRVRKQNLEAMLSAIVTRLRQEGRAVRVVDIAAGHGRYVLDALHKIARPGDSILLRDYSEINVAAGRMLIEQMAMQGIARFEPGDAFDQGSLARLSPRPTLAVVSGLYELFPDNSLLQRSLAGLASALEPASYLVYTNQPWHPQLELIARTLTSHREGKPWIMRRRTQAEMDQLVEAAGFAKLDQLIDEWGIFSVSVARRAP